MARRTSPPAIPRSGPKAPSRCRRTAWCRRTCRASEPTTGPGSSPPPPVRLSPPVWRRSDARYSEPARTLSEADCGFSGVAARFLLTQSHVPGMTCMMPRALADDTIALLNPLSCQAIAAASEAGAPCCAASALTCSALRRPGVGTGFAAGTTRVAGAGAAAFAGRRSTHRQLDDGSGQQMGGRAQAVHVGHLRRRDARLRGEPAQRVTGAHDVGAERTGRCAGRRAMRHSSRLRFRPARSLRRAARPGPRRPSGS